MKKHPTRKVAKPVRPTHAEDLQTALDDIARLTGRLDSQSEIIAIAFARLTEIGDQVERLEAS